MRRVVTWIAGFAVVLQLSASGWREVESLETDGYSYVEGLDPFSRAGSFGPGDARIGAYTPEILRWGTQRNVGVEFSGGLFSNRVDFGLSDQRRTTANYTPRLMPFGGPLEYSQGRNFSFTLDEPLRNIPADADFIQFYQYAMPFRDSSGELELSIGEYGSLTSILRSELPVERLQLSTELSWREFGNFRDGNDVMLTESLDQKNPKVRYIDEADDQDIYEIRSIETSGKVTISPTQSLEFNGKYTESEGVFFPELRMDAEYDRGSNISAVYHIQNPSAGVQRLSIRAFSAKADQELNDRWRQSKLDNLEAPARDDFSTRANSRSSTQGFDFRAIKEFYDLQIGFGMRQYWQDWEALTETLGVESAMLPVINQSNLGAYLEAERFLGNFLLSAAVRIDQLDTEVDGDIGFIRRYRSDVTRRERDSALSLSVRLDYDLTDWSSWYVEVGHAARTPDPNEMYVQYMYERAPGNELVWVGNPDLDSVKNTSMDMGIEINLRRFKFRINGFYSNVVDMIYLEDISPMIRPESGGVFLGTAMSYNNVDAVLHGGNAYLDFRINDAFTLTGGVEFTQGRKKQLDGLSGDRDLAELQPLRAKLALEYNNRLWFGKVELQMAEAQYAVDESISETALDGYTVVNLLLGYYLTRNLLFTLGVENLSDQSYSTKNVNIRNPFTNYGVSNEPGRFVYMSLKWGF